MLRITVDMSWIVVEKRIYCGFKHRVVRCHILVSGKKGEGETKDRRTGHSQIVRLIKAR